MTLDAIRETCDVPHLNPDAIGANVWQEAATSQLCQRGGYEILRESAIAAAAGSGKGASLAVAALGSGFDMGIADAIRDGLIMVHISPLELALGYIPLLQLGLIQWYRNHLPSPPKDGGLLAIAQALSFRSGSAFDPEHKWMVFYTAYGAARAARERFDPHAVQCALIHAMVHAGTAAETATATIGLDHRAASSSASITADTNTWYYAATRAVREQQALRAHEPPRHFQADSLRALVSLIHRMVDAHIREVRLKQLTDPHVSRAWAFPPQEETSDPPAAPHPPPAESPSTPLAPGGRPVAAGTPQQGKPPRRMPTPQAAVAAAGAAPQSDAQAGPDEHPDLFPPLPGVAPLTARDDRS